MTGLEHLDRAAFVARYGGVFEHSPWVAMVAYDAGLAGDTCGFEGLHRVLCAAMRAGTRDQQLRLIQAHPDLAGRLARSGALTAESTREQASAGLDQLSDDEFERFTALNDAYKTKFGFPFIMAVKGCGKAEVLEAFERRIEHDPETELATALSEIERIALLRLKDLVP